MKNVKELKVEEMQQINSGSWPSEKLVCSIYNIGKDVGKSVAKWI